MKFCKKCGYPDNHPLGIVIDKEGICSGCKLHSNQTKSDWEKREEELFSLVKNYRSNSKVYECVIPVTGDGDSYSVVEYVIKKLKLRPLLVSYNNLFMNDIGFKNLSNLKIVFDCDLAVYQPSIQEVRDLIKASLFHIGSIYWHSHAGLTCFPIWKAIEKEIPLIIWGGQESVIQTGIFDYNDKVEMSRWYRSERHLMGCEIDDLEDFEPAIKKNNNSVYRYPNQSDIDKLQLRGIYLSNYIDWDRKVLRDLATKKYGYIQKPQAFSANPAKSPGCSFYGGIHDYLKYIKLGYWSLFDYNAQEIRRGRLTLEKSKKQMLEFLPNLNSIEDNIKIFSDFLEISPLSLKWIIEQKKDQNLFSDNISKLVLDLFKNDEKIVDFKNLSTINSLSKTESNIPRSDQMFNKIFHPGFP